MRLTAKHTTQAMINEKNLTKGQMKELKLSQLEDIEERYGIEILTIFKVITDGCYYLYNGKIEHFKPSGIDFACLNLDNESIDLMYASPYENSCRVDVTLFFSIFGKTWALTKEELL